MSDLPASQYMEAHGDGYRLAGTRISLDSIAYAVRRGETVEEIPADFPALESRRKLEGVVVYVQLGSWAKGESTRSCREGSAIP